MQFQFHHLLCSSICEPLHYQHICRAFDGEADGEKAARRAFDKWGHSSGKKVKPMEPPFSGIVTSIPSTPLQPEVRSWGLCIPVKKEMIQIGSYIDPTTTSPFLYSRFFFAWDKDSMSVFPPLGRVAKGIGKQVGSE